MQKFNFNNPGGLLNLNPNDTGSLGINISPINEQKKLEEEERKRAERSRKLQNLADTFNMIGANQSGDTQRMAFHSNRLAQRRAEDEARQLKAQDAMNMQNYFGSNKYLAEIAGIFGKETAFAVDQKQKAQQKLMQEQNAQAEINFQKEKRRIDSLTAGGLTPEQANAVVYGGLTFDEATSIGIDEDAEEEKAAIQSLVDAGISETNAKAVIIGGANLSDLVEDEITNTGPSIVKEVRESVTNLTKNTKLQDDYANLGQAFGPIDSLQENLLNSPGRKLFGKDFASETAASIRDKDNLNLEILATLANDYTGRPSNLLLGEIKKNIPEGSATSEADAYQKYSNFLIQTQSRIQNLEQGILSPNVKDDTKEKYREELYKSLVLEQKLIAATASLAPNKKANLEASETQDVNSTGQYNNYFVPTN